MEIEDRRKIQRTLDLVEENNKMLKKMVRSMRWTRLMHIIYALVIIGASIGIFYYVQPIFNQLLETYGAFKDSVNRLGNVFN